MFRFLEIRTINNDQLLPGGVIRYRDTHDVVRLAFRRDQNFHLHSFEFFEGETLEQRASGGGEIMLHRIGESEVGRARNS